MRWTVLIPVKALPEAKSRLAAHSADPAAHRRLVEAIRADTVDAARAAAGVARVVLVVDRPGTAVPDGVEVFLQRELGLNAGLSEGAEQAAARWPDDGVAALLGDLPALRPAELADALRAASGAIAGFVPDAAGTGTTLLTTRPGSRLAPRFGAGSAARHARSARRLEAGPGLRHDVDTGTDLRAAVELGVGTATRAELAASEGSARSSGSGIVKGMTERTGDVA